MTMTAAAIVPLDVISSMALALTRRLTTAGSAMIAAACSFALRAASFSDPWVCCVSVMSLPGWSNDLEPSVLYLTRAPGDMDRP